TLGSRGVAQSLVQLRREAELLAQSLAPRPGATDDVQRSVLNPGAVRLDDIRRRDGRNHRLRPTFSVEHSQEVARSVLLGRQEAEGLLPGQYRSGRFSSEE